MLAGVLKTAVGVVGALWLAIAGWAAAQWWERRPAGQPRIEVLMFRWSPPDSLAAQRDRAYAALTRCGASRSLLDDALRRQNEAVETLREETTRRLARAQAALARQRPGAEAARARAAGLLATLQVGDDACRRVAEADRRVLEALR